MIELVKGLVYAGVALSIGLAFFFWAAKRDIKLPLQRRLFQALIASQAVVFLSPNLLVCNILLALMVPIFARTRPLVAPVYLFLMLTLPLVGTFFSIGQLYLATYDTNISLAAGAFVALLTTRGGRLPRRLQWDVPVLLFALLLFAASARGSSATNLLRLFLDTCSQVLLPYLIVSRGARDPAGRRLAVAGVIAATAALCSLAIFEAFRSWPLYRVVWPHFGISMVATANVKMRGGLLRSAGPYPEPTSFAFALALGTLAAIAARSTFRGNARQFWLVMLLLAGGFMPNSRGAVAGLVLGTLALLAYQKRHALLGKVAAVGAAAGATVFAVAQASQQFASVTGLDAGGQGTIDYRTRLWNRGIEEIRAHPVFGASVSDVVVRMRDLVQGEGVIDFVNVYIFIGLISGLVGLFVFVVALLMPIAALTGLRRRLSVSPELLEQGAWVVGGLAALMTMIAFTSMTGRNETMLVVLFAMGSAVLNGSRRAGSVRPAPSAVRPSPLYADRPLAPA